MRDRPCLFPHARTLARALAASALLASAAGAAAQPSIQHDEVRCLPQDEFTRFVARILPPDRLRSVRLYFRAEFFPEYYFVDMTETEARYSAVLPLPAEQTRRVVYYIEVVDQTFQISRSEEFVVGVMEGDCQPGPGALLVAGNPGIVVGAVSGGAPGIPAGFQATGIVGFVSGAGAGGGGLGVGLAVGAVAGAAAGVGVLAAGNDDGVGGGSVTTVTTSIAPTGGGTTTTTPAGGTPTTTTPTPQAPTTTTTIAPTTSSVPPPPLSACFNWAATNNCRVDFHSCSGPEAIIVRHDWRMLGPPVPAPVPSPESNTREFTYDFAGDPRCAGAIDFNRPVRLTVTDSLGRSAQIQKTISVRPGSALRTTAGRILLRSSLAAEPPDGSVRGQVLVDGVPLPVVSNQGPFELRADVASGEAIVEAILQTRSAPGTRWEFDLSANPGSSFRDIIAESGATILVGNGRIVFRLEGWEGERVRFRARSR